MAMRPQQCAASCVAVILLLNPIYRGWVWQRLLVVLPGTAQWTCFHHFVKVSRHVFGTTCLIFEPQFYTLLICNPSLGAREVQLCTSFLFSSTSHRYQTCQAKTLTHRGETNWLCQVNSSVSSCAIFLQLWGMRWCADNPPTLMTALPATKVDWVPHNCHAMALCDQWQPQPRPLPQCHPNWGT